MSEQKATQAERVLAYIEEFGSITQLEALKDLGVMRLGSRISDLKKQGYPIKSDVETVKSGLVKTAISNGIAWLVVKICG